MWSTSGQNGRAWTKSWKIKPVENMPLPKVAKSWSKVAHKLWRISNLKLLESDLSIKSEQKNGFKDPIFSSLLEQTGSGSSPQLPDTGFSMDFSKSLFGNRLTNEQTDKQVCGMPACQSVRVSGRQHCTLRNLVSFKKFWKQHPGAR